MKLQHPVGDEVVHLFNYYKEHRHMKEGARGARAPPIFFRGVQSTPNNSMHTVSVLNVKDACRMNMNVCRYANNYHWYTIYM